MSETPVLISIPGDYEGIDTTVIFTVPLTDWNDEPFVLSVTVTPEGIITDVLTVDGELIETEGEMFADMAFRLMDQG